jgi:uncharacterized protein YciI
MFKLETLMALKPAVLALAMGALMTSATHAAPDQPLFAVIYRPGPAWKAGLPMAQQDLGAHAGYIARLAVEGRVVAGGGWVGLDGGMALLRCADAEEAARLLAADPAITTGVFQADVRRWSPRFGVDADLVPKPATPSPRPQP